MKIGTKLQKVEIIDQLFKLEMSKLLEEARLSLCQTYITNKENILISSKKN